MKSIKTLSDERLVELVRTKDSQLFIEVVKRYQEKLLRYSNYLINDNEEAKDIVQESFIKAYKNLFSFDTNKKFSSWIYRIVHNESVNVIKKKKKEISLDNNHYLVDSITNEKTIEEEIEEKEMKKKVKQSLSKLPIKYKEPMVLFFLEERKYEEISDILRLPVGTVGIRINRGKILLKKIYQKKGGENYV